MLYILQMNKHISCLNTKLLVILYQMFHSLLFSKCTDVDFRESVKAQNLAKINLKA